jgi:BNR-Asp box repeat
MATLWVGSRKGLFRFDDHGRGWQSAGPPAFLAGPVTAVLDDPRDGCLYVSLHHGHFGCKLHRSDDRGKSWTELPPPAYPKSDDPDAPALEFIWCFAAGGVDEPGVIWAGTLPGGLFKSTDRGQTWALNDALWNQPQRKVWFGAGYDHAGIHSICIDPRDARHIVIAVSIGGVWITRDGGISWVLGGHGLRNEYMPPGQEQDPNAQDAHLIAACTADPDRIWCQHHNGIFVSDDGGMHWRESLDVRPSAFGFAVAPHPTDRDRAWFAPARKDEYRVPVDARLVVTETRDGGETYTSLSQGLPQHDAYDLIYRHALVIDQTGDRLAMGSTTGGLWVSDNQGAKWQLLSAHLPPIAALAFAPGP